MFIYYSNGSNTVGGPTKDLRLFSFTNVDIIKETLVNMFVYVPLFVGIILGQGYLRKIMDTQPSVINQGLHRILMHADLMSNPINLSILIPLSSYAKNPHILKAFIREFFPTYSQGIF